MKRSRHLAALVVTALAVSLVGTTSYAAYRTTIGVERCCKTRCHHQHQDRREAERCCAKHPAVDPGATAKAASAQDLQAAAHLVCRLLPAEVVPAAAQLVPLTMDGRAPPGASLFAHHTSLLI